MQWRFVRSFHRKGQLDISQNTTRHGIQKMPWRLDEWVLPTPFYSSFLFDGF